MKRFRIYLSLALTIVMLLTSLSYADQLFQIPIKTQPIVLNPLAVPKVFQFESTKTVTPLALDGTQSGWAEQEIQDAYSYGLTYGEVEKNFQKLITREEFSTIAVKLFEKLSGKTATVKENPFTDTSNPEILKAYAIGIVKGTGATTFSPSNNITRQEICVMIQRALKASYPNLDIDISGDFPFNDLNKIADWAIDSMKYAYKNEIMKGTGSTTISPLNNTTREQAIALLKRTYIMGSTNQLPMTAMIDPKLYFEKNVIYPVQNIGALGSSVQLSISKNIFDSSKINIGLIPGIITGTTPSSSSGFPLKSSDYNLKGVTWLGKGVNIITSKYADANSLGDYYILDPKKLLNDGRIYKIDTNSSNSRYISGQSAWTYAESMATSVNAGGKYLFFGGSVGANFSSSSLTEKNRSYATLMYEAYKYGLSIDDQSIDLKNYLSDSFTQAIKTMDAKQLFELYGTHVLRSIRLGGRIEYNVTTDSTYQSSSNSMELDVKTSFNALFASANIGVSTSSSTTSTEFFQHSERNIKAYPAYGSADLDPVAFQAWFNAMLMDPGISDYGNNPMIPIWELTSDANRRNYLEQEYHKYAASKNFIPQEVTYGINGIRIQRYRLGETIPKEYKDPVTGDLWKYVSNIKAYLWGKSGEEFACLYVREGFSNDVSKPPVVGLFMVNHTQGEDPIQIFKQLYGDDPDARLWGYAGQMEQNSGLDYYINYDYGDKLCLFYVTSRNKPQIAKLRVRNLDLNGKTQYYPKEMASELNFKPVIDIGSYNKGKIEPQDTTEGAPYTVGSTVFGLYFVNRFYYIEYKY